MIAPVQDRVAGVNDSNVEAESASSAAKFRVQWTARQRVSRWLFTPLNWLQGRLLRRFLRMNAAGVAFWISQLPIIFSVVATLVRLRIFDRLSAGPQSAGELATACGADEGALLRMLRTAAVIGVLERDRHNRFSLSPVGRQFLSDSPNPVAHWTELLDRLVVAELPRMTDAVIRGESLVKTVHGKTCWDVMSEMPGTTELHDIACGRWTELVVDQVAKAYDFSSVRTVIDVGGGRGAFLSAMLRAAPRLEGRVYDRSTTRLAAQTMFASRGVAERAAHVAGDFFQSVPAGADLYTIKHVLHDWDDEHAFRILRNIRKAVPEHGRLLIVEGSTDHDLLPSQSILAVWDVSQFAATWGKSRTLDEFSQLVESAGFTMKNIHVPQALDSLILECVPRSDWQCDDENSTEASHHWQTSLQRDR